MHFNEQMRVNKYRVWKPLCSFSWLKATKKKEGGASDSVSASK